MGQGSKGLGFLRNRFAVLVYGLALACGPSSAELGAGDTQRPGTETGATRVTALRGDTSATGDDPALWEEQMTPLNAKELFWSQCPSAADAQGPTLYVANTGPRDAEAPLGSSDNPFPTIMAAVKVAQPGDVIQVREGTYPEQVAINPLKARPGTATSPIVLRGEPSRRPRIIPSTTDVGSLLVLSQPYWIVQSVEVDVLERPSFAALFEDSTTCSQLTDSVLHGGRAGGGVVVSDATRVLVDGNAIHDFSRTGFDSHGVAVKGSSREVFILENTIHDASGDGVQCQPSEARPSTLFIERNQMYDCGENGIDVKACDDIAIYENVLFRFPNLERYPWQEKTSAAEAVLIHEDATNIQIVGNLVFQAGRGISIGGTSPVDNPVNVLVQGNRVTDIYNFANRHNGQGIRVVRAQGVRVLGNLIERTADSGLRLAADEPFVVSDLTVFDNTLRDMRSFVKLGRDTSRPGLRLDRNRYEGASGIFSAFGLLSEGDFAAWHGKLTPYGLEQHSVRVTPGDPDDLPLPMFIPTALPVLLGE
ncbi:right-handed parallel beta-helix repeat-containing protein [Myxococcus sp. CA039A]|uniref:right-handed parallel beta-helix repeat-containing protein n=1 Tax=Myxococcus sp. CA039A TaxID=2741737 RepID=UPI00157A38B7|nr:right-handed parallel beta-helix repeat-containing protein [Myxococcus sp. CA039A]NTX56431.1 right-handed parallel beta-helix repeat-containing protein [Myxococcus sp. CA039A]